jgi:putative sugar O-methyltransferase
MQKEGHRVKEKYLRHPMQTAKAAKAALMLRFSVWKFARHGKRRFRSDPRYDLQNVTEGFRPRLNDSKDDAILKRISVAYCAAARQQESAPLLYAATERRQRLRQGSLAPFIAALLAQDVDALGRMYRNFYRDACSTGIVGLPSGISEPYFGGTIKDMYRHFYLSHVLYRLDYWKSQTNGRFTVQELRGPGVGNPFGLVIDGTHISVGSEYSHYCAQRVAGELEPGSATIAEIGGGFGGMAYYLLRDRQNTTYIDFDAPESVALASYYLMKAFPALRFFLYGEGTLTQDAIAQADVVMLPTFALATMPAASADLTFTSYGMAELSSAAMAEYLKEICRITREGLLLIGNQRVGEMVSETIRTDHDPFKLTNTCLSGWHSHKVSGAGVGGAAGRAASTAFEQSYSRSS